MGAGRVERLIVPVARRRARRAVHRWDDASTDSGSGWRSPAGPPAVSPAVGTRWFREGGGMPNVSRAPLSGRSLSFAEREELAILRAQAVGARDRTAAGTVPLDHLQGTAPQRRNPWRAAAVSGHDRPLARRPAGQAPQGRQAGCQPAAPELCAAAAGVRSHDAAQSFHNARPWRRGGAPPLRATRGSLQILVVADVQR
jgi:hypothetical protein